MALSPGTRLGPYEIIAPLGAGGMGEVYTASDSRLGRKVALKIVSRAFASDPDRIRRFEQEARAAAAVTHPALLSVYDIGTDNGQPFIVSELLDGTSLRERITPDGLPVSRVVALGLQIAHGLAAAHEHGVVHRDLKPENIFVTADGRAKILDFGLAKLSQPDAAEAGATMTALPADTQPGLVLGTIGYMAPEQVRGHSADARSDIFSFGAILYEMASGRRAFAGETMADTMSAILAKEPADITSSVHVVPPGLQQIIRHCLEKAPEHRFQSARDLAFALEAISTSSGTTIQTVPPTRSRAEPRTRLWQAVAVVSTVAAIALAFALLVSRRRTPVDPPVATFSILNDDGLPPEGGMRYPAFAISPNGRFIASKRRDGDQDKIWIRPIDGGEPYALDLSAGLLAGRMIWSPDSESILFATSDGIERIDIRSRTPQRIVPRAPHSGRPGDWSPSGVVVLITRDGLFQAPDTGGTPQPFVLADEKQGDTVVLPGGFLPDGRHYVYTLYSSSAARAGVWIGSLDGGQAIRVMPGETADAIYAEPGYLLLMRSNTLVARSLDPVRLTVGTTEIPVASNIALNPSALGGQLSVSSVGSLVFRMGGTETAHFDTYDASGQRLGPAGQTDLWENFSVSPDGRRIAAARGDEQTSVQHIAVIDRGRNVTTTLTLGEGIDSDPVWSRDGKLAFSSFRNGEKHILLVSPEGGPATRLGPVSLRGGGGIDAWSPDGRYLLFHEPQHLMKLAVKDGHATTITNATARLDEAEWSPDGRWITYDENDTGRYEVYAIPDPPTGERWQLSSAGGVQPRWSPDGHHVFYLDPAGTLVRVDLPTGRPADASSPHPLFQTTLTTVSGNSDQYRVLPDGTFLIEDPVTVKRPREYTIILNWPTLVHEREHAR